MNNANDDWLNDDDDFKTKTSSSSSTNSNERELHALKERMFKIGEREGYLLGLKKGEEVGLIAGYTEELKNSIALGKLFGAAKVVDNVCKSEKTRKDLKALLDALELKMKRNEVGCCQMLIREIP